MPRLRAPGLLRGLSRCVSYVQGQSPSPKTREYFYYIDHQGQLFLDDARLKNFITCFKEKKFLTFFFRRIKPNSTGRYEADFPYVSPCGPEMNYIRCDDLPVVFTHLLDQDGNVIEDIAKYGSGGDRHVSPGDVSAVSIATDEHHIAKYGSGGDRPVSPGDGSTVSIATDEHHIAKYGSEDGGRPVSRDGSTVSIATDEHQTDSVPTELLSYGDTGDKLTVPFVPSKLCMLPGSGRVYHAGVEKLGGVGLVKSSLAIGLSRFFVYETGADENSAPIKFTWRGRTWDLDPLVLMRLEKAHRKFQLKE